MPEPKAVHIDDNLVAVFGVLKLGGDQCAKLMHVELRGIDIEIGKSANRGELGALVAQTCEHGGFVAERMRTARFTEAAAEHFVFGIKKKKGAAQACLEVVKNLRELLERLAFTDV